MIDDAGAAPAAAEPIVPTQDSAGAAAPIADTPARPEQSPRAAIDRAFASVDKEEDARAALLDVDPEALGKPRDEQGRFKAKDAQPVTPQTPEQQAADKALADKAAAEKATGQITEAPSRFSADAKAAWASVPDPVKGEVHRAFRELEGGLSQYQQFFEPLKPYYQLAEKHETTVHDTLGRYVSLDMQLASQKPEDKFSAIQEVLEYAGFSPQEYAALISGQKPDQVHAQSAAEIRQLKGEIAGMKQQLGSVHFSIQKTHEERLSATVDEFAKTHTRMNDATFTSTVTRLISTGWADGLESAYQMAERLIPAPATDTQQQAASSAANPPKPTDQTRKGSLSVTGPPVSGSNPAKRKPASSARESLDRAFAEVGL